MDYKWNRTEWGRSHSALDVNMFPLVSIELCAILPSVNGCFAHVFWRNVLYYSVIQKYGLNFVSLYFKIRTSDKYDTNYIWLYSQ